MIEISEELLIEIIPLYKDEEYDKFYTVVNSESLSIGYSYNIIY